MKIFSRLDEIQKLLELAILDNNSTIVFVIPDTIIATTKFNIWTSFGWVTDYGYSIEEYVNSRMCVNEYKLSKTHGAKYDIQEYIKRERRILAGCYWHPSTKVKQ